MITPENQPKPEDQNPFSQNLPSLRFGTARFVKDISESLLVNRTEADRAFSITRDGIAELIVSSGHLCLSGLGTFELRLRKEHERFNPRTEETMVIPPKVAVHFTPGGKLKSAIFSKLNGSEVEQAESKTLAPFILVRDPNQPLNELFLQRVEQRGEANRQTLLDLMVVKGLVSCLAAQQVYRAFATSLSSQLSELAQLSDQVVGSARRPSIRIHQVGTFRVVPKAEMTWMNPESRTQIIIGPRKAITFKVATRLEQKAQSKLEKLQNDEQS